MKEKIKKILSERTWQPLSCCDSLTPAAVLVPLFCKNGEIHLLFTKRTDTVRHHKGQISFPGGASDDTDKDLEETALRETHEEVGIEPPDVEILGMLDQSRTVTDYVITPFVGVIPYPYEFTTSPVEVDELIEVPATYLLDESNLGFGPIDYGGMTVHAEQYIFDGHVIWGATMRILHQFRVVLGDVLLQHYACS